MLIEHNPNNEGQAPEVVPVTRTVSYSHTPSEEPVKWPDFSIDQRAWELAKTALSFTDEDLKDPVKREALCTRAQEIKEQLKKSA